MKTVIDKLTEENTKLKQSLSGALNSLQKLNKKYNELSEENNKLLIHSKHFLNP